MEWSDEAVILSVRPHGETAAVVELLTRRHGRHSGLVHGGRSRRARPVLQMGNHVTATWKARLSEHLGHMAVELQHGYAAACMDDAAALAALNALCAMTRLLPERDPHPNLYEITLFVLSFLDDQTVWPALYVRWELALLDAEPRSATAAALSEVLAFRIDQEDFYDVMEERSEVLRNILRMLCQRIRAQNEKMRALAG